MRNPVESWDKSDSEWVNENKEFSESIATPEFNKDGQMFKIGNKDYKLAMNLVTNGVSHRKFMRQIFFSMDIEAPLYWWKQMATYKVGTTFNSTSQMHLGGTREYTKDDFVYISDEKLARLNRLVDSFNKTRKPKMKKQLIKEIPQSYLYLRTVSGNYENLRNIYHDRKNHFLDEWSEVFCDYLERMPYSEFITKEGG